MSGYPRENVDSSQPYTHIPSGIGFHIRVSGTRHPGLTSGIAGQGVRRRTRHRRTLRDLTRCIPTWLISSWV